MGDTSLDHSRILGSAQTANMLGYSVVHFRRLVKDGVVPAPIRIGTRKLGWRAGDIISFVASKGAA